MINDNHYYCHLDQDWLEETDDICSGPNHCAEDNDEKKHKAGSQRRPHHLSLPGGGIFLHVTFSTPDLERSLRRIRFFGQIFANCLLGSLNLVREGFVFWIERQCFLPGF